MAEDEMSLVLLTGLVHLYELDAKVTNTTASCSCCSDISHLSSSFDVLISLQACRRSEETPSCSMLLPLKPLSCCLNAQDWYRACFWMEAVGCSCLLPPVRAAPNGTRLPGSLGTDGIWKAFIENNSSRLYRRGKTDSSFHYCKAFLLWEQKSREGVLWAGKQTFHCLQNLAAWVAEAGAFTWH